MISYRPATSADRAFIVSGWSASQRLTRDIPLITNRDWAAVWRPVVTGQLDRPGVETLVAAGEVLQGFIAFERPSYVLYCYVAQPFRRRGIARGLFAAAGIDPTSRFEYACRTRTSWECRDKIKLAHYDPFRARFEQENNHEDR